MYFEPTQGFLLDTHVCVRALAMVAVVESTPRTIASYSKAEGCFFILWLAGVDWNRGPIRLYRLQGIPIPFRGRPIRALG